MAILSALVAFADVARYVVAPDPRILPILSICSSFSLATALIRARFKQVVYATYLMSVLIVLSMIGVVAAVSGFTGLVWTYTAVLPPLFVGLILGVRHIIPASALSLIGTLIATLVDQHAVWQRLDLVATPVRSGVMSLVASGLLVLMGAVLFHRLDQSIRAARESARRLQLLYETSRLFGESVELNRLLAAIADRMPAIVDADACFIVLRDPASGALTPTAADSARHESYRSFKVRPDESSVALATIQQRKPIVIEDVSNSPYVSSRVASLFPVQSVLSLPLIHRSEALGAIIIGDSRRRRTFTQDEIDRVQGLAQQIATEIANAQAVERERRQAAELAMLNRVSATVAASLDPVEVCRLIVQEINQAGGFEHTSLYLLKEKTLHLQAVIGYASMIDEMPIERGILGKTARSGEPMLLPDVRLDPDYVAASPEVISEACAPIHFGNETLGVINIETVAPRVLDAYDLSLLVAIAAQIAVTLRNAQLFDQARRNVDGLSFLYEMAGTAAATLDYSQIMRLVGAGLMRSLNAQKCSFSRWEQSAGVVISIGEYQLDANQVIIVADELGETYRLDDYPETQRVLETQAAVQIQAGVPNAPQEEIALLHRLGYTSLLMLPLVTPAGVFGLIEIYRVQVQCFQPDEVSRSLAVANLAATALERERLFDAERRSRLVTETLLEVTHALGGTLDRGELLNLILDQLHVLIPYHSAAIALPEPDGRFYTLCASRNLPASLPSEAFVIEADKLATTRRLIRSREPFRIADTQAYPDWALFENFEHIRSWLGLPLLRNDQVIGLLMIDHTRPGFFTEEHQRLAEAFAQHAAIAIENARLLDQARRQAEREHRVRDIGSKISASIDLDTVMQTAVAELGRAFNAARCLIRLGADPDHMPVAYEFHQPGVQPVQVGSLGHSPRLITSVSERRTVIDPQPHWVGDVLVQTCLMTPIVVRDRVIGILSLECDRPRQATPDDLALIESINAQISIAMDNARLYQEATHSLSNLNLLHSTAIAVASASSLDEALHRVVESMHAAKHNSRVAVMLIDPDTSDLVIRAHSSAQFESAHLRIKMGEGVTGWVARTGQPALVFDVRSDPRYMALEGNTTSRSELAVPLVTGSEVVGVLNLESSVPDAFDEADLQLFNTLGGNLAMIIRNLRLLDEVREANIRLRELDRLKSQFLANMSHELRTPLNAIIGFGEVLTDGLAGELNDSQREFVTNIYTSGKHLLRLINDVLDLSKIQAGKLVLDCRPIDPRGVIDEALSVMSPLTAKKNQELALQLEPVLPAVNADAFRLKQILLNLLSNAHKFSPDDRRITLAARRDGGYVRFSVIDQGDGIRPEDQDRVFQEFAQLGGERARHQEGTGLGLSITRRLVEMHNGRIWIESEGIPGMGTTFHFTIPTLPALTALAPGTTAGRRQALIIENDCQFSNLLALQLERQGYQTHQHYSGKSALRLVRQIRPTLITLDLMMPDYDGWNVLRDLKATPDTRDLPVIVISALDHADTGFGPDAIEYLPKSFTDDDLLTALQRLDSARRPARHPVLVVEDDPLVIELIEAMLLPTEYIVSAVTSGADAFNAIHYCMPDVVLLDLLMPGMNGNDLLELLRADPTTRDLPVIVLTAKMLGEAEQAHLARTAQIVIQKTDLTRQRLIDALRQLLPPGRPTADVMEVPHDA